MHNTEVKTEVIQHQEQQSSHHIQQQQSNVSHRRMTNGDGIVSGSSRHHREGSTLSMSTNASHECAGCGKRITDRFLLKALDLFWHEDCLKCGCCDCRLGEVGSTLYTKANLILCKRDYLRLFGNTGYCAACSKVIPAFEMVMRARNNVYHLECFACQQCNHRFCVGDRFYLCENKILCEYDYEERMVFANMACSPGNLAILRRQVSTFQQSGSQSEQQQRAPQLQQQFQSSSSIFSINNPIDQYQQFDQQSKYTPALPVPKIPVSESLVAGNYSSLANSPPPPSPHNYCSATGYITPQTRVNKERTDPFLNVKCNLNPNLVLSHSPAKRPKQSFPSFGNNDNLDLSPATIPCSDSENRNNNGSGFEKMQPIFLPTPPAYSPMFLQAVRDAEDFLMSGSGTNKIKMAKQSSAPIATGNNVTMGSPDSGIVEGP